MTDEVNITIDTPEQTGLSPEISTSPHSDVFEGDLESLEGKAWLASHAKPVDPIKEDVVLEGDKPPKKNHQGEGGGRPCKYCAKSEKYQTLSDDYVQRFLVAKEKLIIPFAEELALILNVLPETLSIWSTKTLPDSEKLEHPEFAHTYKKLLTIQKLRLLQRTLGRFNPTGAIFQLKVNHGLIEAEKKILTGDSKEPLIIELINEKKITTDE